MTTFRKRYQVIERDKTGDEAIYETDRKHVAILIAKDIGGWVFDIVRCVPVEVK